MPSPAFEALSPAIAAALTSRGFTALTTVQEAVLDPALAGRDLRISSQTGSGKTVAVGLVLVAGLEAVVKERAEAAAAAPSAQPGPCRPAALLVAPTRELAAQLQKELSWLYQPIGVRVAAVVGGTSYGGELRSLRTGPLVIVGTPGRLLDHLERGSIDPSAAFSVVLDEADQMLDLGFRDELEAILGKTPTDRRTHLVSATFPREVLSLANRYQRNAADVQGTQRGEANEDITHIAHMVRSGERDAVIVNLLLLNPGERTLVFVRTRADAADIADRLANRGFGARALSGEMEQWERTKTLDAFRNGNISTLVATDVAARGLDVPDVSRVIHADPPNDPEAFTHRSGRTGRAGRKGTSIVLLPPSAREGVGRLFRRARVEATFQPAPTVADVLRAADDRLIAELTAAPAEDAKEDARLRGLADRLLATEDPARLVTALLGRARHTGACAPEVVTPISLTAQRPQSFERGGPARGYDNGPRGGYDNGPRGGYDNGPRGGYDNGPRGGYDNGPRNQDNGPRGGQGQAPSHAPNHLGFVPFRVTWGERHGADPRRVLALVCRRGGIQGNQVGAIRIGEVESTFEVATPVAAEFAELVRKPDTRDPRIRIEALVNVGPSAAPGVAPRAPFQERSEGGAPQVTPPAQGAPGQPAGPRAPAAAAYSRRDDRRPAGPPSVPPVVATPIAGEGFTPPRRKLVNAARWQ
jgi:ATP-dependent RNA helicase DeaD